MLYQFFSYQFLHGDLPHLLGNMLFLWVFGNSVNGNMCGGAYLLQKYSKRDGPFIACPHKECGYRRSADPEAPAPEGAPA